LEPRSQEGYRTMLREKSGTRSKSMSRSEMGRRGEILELFINAQSFTCIQMMFLVGSFNWNPHLHFVEGERDRRDCGTY